MLNCVSTIRILFVFGRIIKWIILIRANSKICYSVQPYLQVVALVRRCSQHTIAHVTPRSWSSLWTELTRCCCSPLQRSYSTPTCTTAAYDPTTRWPSTSLSIISEVHCLLSCLLLYHMFIIILLLLFFIPPVVKISRGLKTKVKNVAGMAIGPGNRRWMSRAKARSWNVGSSQRCAGIRTEPLCRRRYYFDKLQFFHVNSLWCRGEGVQRVKMPLQQSRRP